MRVRQEDRGQDQEQQGGLGVVEAMVAMLAGVGEGGTTVGEGGTTVVGKAGSTGGSGRLGIQGVEG